MLTEKQVIRQMDNKHLLETVNKIKKEKANPQVYGKHGTSRWVTSSEFWSGHHGDLKAEVQRRQNLGLIKKSAAIPRKKQNLFGGFKF